MHPHFDYVFLDILKGNPEGHIVVTGGRRPAWTETYIARLRDALGEEMMLRLHLIDRVSSEKFLALLRIADAMLHPFPFDGSRTSVDGLIANIPVVTMPTGFVLSLSLPLLQSFNVTSTVVHFTSVFYCYLYTVIIIIISIIAILL